MKVAIDRPDDGRQAQHDQKQYRVVPEHGGGGHEHLPDLHQADKQHFLHADPDILDVGGHATDDSANTSPVIPSHLHRLKVLKQSIPQIADHRFA